VHCCSFGEVDNLNLDPVETTKIHTQQIDVLEVGMDVWGVDVHDAVVDGCGEIFRNGIGAKEFLAGLKET
jgi:hypothetical protein